MDAAYINLWDLPLFFPFLLRYLLHQTSYCFGGMSNQFKYEEETHINRGSAGLTWASWKHFYFIIPITWENGPHTERPRVRDKQPEHGPASLVKCKLTRPCGLPATVEMKANMQHSQGDVFGPAFEQTQQRSPIKEPDVSFSWDRQQPRLHKSWKVTPFYVLFLFWDRQRDQHLAHPSRQPPIIRVVNNGCCC